MALTKCGACGNSTFELKLNEPKGSLFKLYFVQCAACGVAIGIQEYNNVDAMLHQQNKAIKEIAAKVGATVTLETGA
jgi:hypothetical protein